MQLRDEGHPRAAMLLLFSMFAFAAVFHVVTRQGDLLPAHFDAQLAAFAGGIDADVPAMSVRAVTQRAQPPVAPAVQVAEAIADPEPAPPTVEAPAIIAASSWPAVAVQTPVAMAVAPSFPQDAAVSGAVTRALVTTRSTLRNAFRRAF